MKEKLSWIAAATESRIQTSTGIMKWGSARERGKERWSRKIKGRTKAKETQGRSVWSKGGWEKGVEERAER